jgi:4-amino-4-deoxy-L-arabinose transferase-like glycosyltransferase
MFKLAEMLHGRKVAVATAALVVLHPVLIAGAASTYSEGPYLTLMMFSMLCLARWAIDRRVSASISAGVLFGLAYLIRPEAFLLAGLFGVGGLIAAMFVRERRRTIVGSLALLSAFAIVAAPNVAFLTYNTGKLRLKRRHTAYQWGQRINQGMSYREAVNGIGQDLSDQGVFMRPNLEVILSASYSLKDYAGSSSTQLRKLRPDRQYAHGPTRVRFPWLFALVVLGLFHGLVAATIVH